MRYSVLSLSNIAHFWGLRSLRVPAGSLVLCGARLADAGVTACASLSCGALVTRALVTRALGNGALGNGALGKDGLVFVGLVACGTLADAVLGNDELSCTGNAACWAINAGVMASDGPGSVGTVPLGALEAGVLGSGALGAGVLSTVTTTGSVALDALSDRIHLNCGSAGLLLSAARAHRQPKPHKAKPTRFLTILDIAWPCMCINDGEPAS